MALFLSFVSRGKHFVIPADRVHEILAIRSISELPSNNPVVRGGLTVRGGVIPLVDFRALTGAQRLVEEREDLVQLLLKREQDHVEWLEALEASVVSGAEFRKTTDPKACAFGKWFHSFKAPDSTVERLLAEFEAPHTEIHALAEAVLAMARSGDKRGAQHLIQGARQTTLRKLLRLFSELRTALVADTRELAIICRSDKDGDFAVAVDAVENIRQISESGFKVRTGLVSTPLVSRIWSTSSETLLEVDVAELTAALDVAKVVSLDATLTAPQG